MSDEAQIHHRVFAYLQDRHDFEVRAAASMSRSPTGETQLPPEAMRSGWEATLQADFETSHRIHLTAKAMTSMAPLGFGDPPTVDAARTEIVRIEVKGRRALVTTLEDEAAGAIPPTLYEYTLEREGGEWLLADRRTRGDEVLGPKWLCGLL